MEIKILGTGCAKCHQLEQTVKEVVSEMGVDVNLENIKDIKKIMEYPILTTPALVIDGNVVCSGRLPTKSEVNTLITNALAKD